MNNQGRRIVYVTSSPPRLIRTRLLLSSTELRVSVTELEPQSEPSGPSERTTQTWKKSLLTTEVGQEYEFPLFFRLRLMPSLQSNRELVRKVLLFVNKYFTAAKHFTKQVFSQHENTSQIYSIETGLIRLKLSAHKDPTRFLNTFWGFLYSTTLLF